jgi:amino acid adenylation domain-containing protein
MKMHGGKQAVSESLAVSTRAIDVRQIILQAARNWPARTAIRGDDTALTYEALGLLVNSAAEVCENYGLGTGDIVGVALARSATSAAIFLALMAAGVSVTVLPDAPLARLRRDIEELGMSLIIAERESPLAKLGTRFADPSEFGTAGGLGGRFDLPATAYLTLTSGSTGRPKAVMVSHGNVAHYADALVERLGLAPDQDLRFAQVTTLAADLGYTAIFPTLLVGGEIVIAPDSIIRQPDAFWTWVRRHRISAVKTTPSHFQALLEARRRSSWTFAKLILGGERLSLALAREILASGCTETLVNHYGPSETTIGVCCHVMRSEHDFAGWRETVPIGSSFGRGELTLKDASREPDGCEVGELVVCGPGVSLGYFGRPDLTAERFELRGGETHGYRTGDICRRSRSGVLQFLGRKDRQIKVRGFIVSPPEVEAVIEDLPGVRKAAVLASEHEGMVRLACAIELERDPQDLVAAVAEFRDALKERLPHWMVPSRILPLRSMPLTPNGKLDYAAIEELVKARPDGLEGDAHPDCEPDAAHHPQVTLAKRIAEVWSDLLGVPPLPLEADIFAAGADSIMLMRSVARLRAEEWRTTLLDIHEHPTPLALATYLLAKPAKADALPIRVSGERVLSPMQGWFFGLGLDDPDHFNQSVLLRSSSAVDPVALCKAVRLLCERHELLCQSFKGPLPGAVRRESALAAFGITMLPVDVAGRERVISSVSAELHRSLRLSHGTVTKVHLFKSEDGAGDRILLVVHHLATDGVSWRILLEELGAAYTACLAGKVLKLPAPASFWDWTAESARSRGASEANQRKSTPSRLFAEHGPRGAVESLVLALGAMARRTTPCWRRCFCRASSTVWEP